MILPMTFFYAPINRRLVMLTKEASQQEAPQRMGLRFLSYLRRFLFPTNDVFFFYSPIIRKLCHADEGSIPQDTSNSDWRSKLRMVWDSDCRVTCGDPSSVGMT